MEKEIIIKELDCDDNYNEYLELMYEFTNYKKDVTIEDFKNYVNQKTKLRIIILKNNENKIIGAGTIFNIEKLHNNSIGQIEDVIITEKYRNMGLGKTIINKLIEIGKTKFKCYKIVLNCLDKNIKFYEKCDFTISGVQMRATNK
jgi:glucosamine-phosphate N-acetyltransferase